MKIVESVESLGNFKIDTPEFGKALEELVNSLRKSLFIVPTEEQTTDIHAGFKLFMERVALMDFSVLISLKGLKIGEFIAESANIFIFHVIRNSINKKRDYLSEQEKSAYIKTLKDIKNSFWMSTDKVLAKIHGLLRAHLTSAIYGMQLIKSYDLLALLDGQDASPVIDVLASKGQDTSTLFSSAFQLLQRTWNQSNKILDAEEHMPIYEMMDMLAQIAWTEASFPLILIQQLIAYQKDTRKLTVFWMKFYVLSQLIQHYRQTDRQYLAEEALKGFEYYVQGIKSQRSILWAAHWPRLGGRDFVRNVLIQFLKEMNEACRTEKNTLMIAQLEGRESSFSKKIDNMDEVRFLKNLKITCNFLEPGLSILKNLSDNPQPTVFVMGNLGSGKSTTIARMMGYKLTDNDDNIFSIIPNSNLPKAPEIGHSKNAQTRYLERFIDNEQSWYYMDCPGFKHNDEERAGVSLLTESVVAASNIKGVLFVIDATSFKSERGSGLLELLSTLKELLKDTTLIEEYCVFAFSNLVKGMKSCAHLKSKLSDLFAEFLNEIPSDLKDYFQDLYDQAELKEHPKERPHFVSNLVDVFQKTLNNAARTAENFLGNGEKDTEKMEEARKQIEVVIMLKKALHSDRVVFLDFDDENTQKKTSDDLRYKISQLSPTVDLRGAFSFESYDSVRATFVRNVEVQSSKMIIAIQQEKTLNEEMILLEKTAMQLKTKNDNRIQDKKSLESKQEAHEKEWETSKRSMQDIKIKLQQDTETLMQKRVELEHDITENQKIMAEMMTHIEKKEEEVRALKEQNPASKKQKLSEEVKDNLKKLEVVRSNLQKFVSDSDINKEELHVISDRVKELDGYKRLLQSELETNSRKRDICQAQLSKIFDEIERKRRSQEEVKGMTADYQRQIDDIREAVESAVKEKAEKSSLESYPEPHWVKSVESGWLWQEMTINYPLDLPISKISIYSDEDPIKILVNAIVIRKEEREAIITDSELAVSETQNSPSNVSLVDAPIVVAPIENKLINLENYFFMGHFTQIKYHDEEIQLEGRQNSFEYEKPVTELRLPNDTVFSVTYRAPLFYTSNITIKVYVPYRYYPGNPQQVVILEERIQVYNENLRELEKKTNAYEAAVKSYDTAIKALEEERSRELEKQNTFDAQKSDLVIRAESLSLEHEFYVNSTRTLQDKISTISGEILAQKKREKTLLETLKTINHVLQQEKELREKQEEREDALRNLQKMKSRSMDTHTQIEQLVYEQEAINEYFGHHRNSYEEQKNNLNNKITQICDETAQLEEDIEKNRVTKWQLEQEIEPFTHFIEEQKELIEYIMRIFIPLNIVESESHVACLIRLWKEREQPIIQDFSKADIADGSTTPISSASDKEKQAETLPNSIRKNLPTFFGLGYRFAVQRSGNSNGTQESLEICVAQSPKPMVGHPDLDALQEKFDEYISEHPEKPSKEYRKVERRYTLGGSPTFIEQINKELKDITDEYEQETGVKGCTVS